MKYLTFAYPAEPDRPRLGAFYQNLVIDLAVTAAWAEEELGLPNPFSQDVSLFELIQEGPQVWKQAKNLLAALEGQDPPELESPEGRPVAASPAEIYFYPPLPRPMSLRDFYAFETHVKTAHENRGKTVPNEWYQMPVFYFSNANAVYGPGETIPYPPYSQALDYELEVACVIGRLGINVPAEEAERYIFGYTIFNDWSARDEQRREMRVGLGPAKGKDFASSLGPWIITPDELKDRTTGRPGVYDLEMIGRVNGAERSRGNWKDLHYSFGEMIARASAGTHLLPGDVLGSGTVGTGCLLELTGGEGPWLQPGDIVELEIERLGILANRVQPRERQFAPGTGPTAEVE